MKKYFLVAGLLAISTNAMAGYYQTFGKHEKSLSLKNENNLELSFRGYSISSNSVKGTEPGLKIHFHHSGLNKVGFEVESEAARVGPSGDSTIIALGTLGATYEATLIKNRLTIKPAIGLFQASVGDGYYQYDDDTSFYAATYLKGDLLPNKISGTLYAKYFDFTYDYPGLWDKSLIGAKLNFHINNNVDVFVDYEKTGNINASSIGATIKF